MHVDSLMSTVVAETVVLILNVSYDICK